MNGNSESNSTNNSTVVGAEQVYDAKRAVDDFMETPIFDDVKVSLDIPTHDDGFYEYCVESVFKGIWESQQPIIPFLDTTFQLIDGSLEDTQSISKVADCLTAIHEQMKQNPTHYVKLSNMLGTQSEQPNSKLSSKPIWKYGGSMLIVDIAVLMLPLLGVYSAFAFPGTLYQRFQNITYSWKLVRMYFNNRYWFKKFKVGDLARIVLLKTKGSIKLDDKTYEQFIDIITEYLLSTNTVTSESIEQHVTVVMYFMLTQKNSSAGQGTEYSKWQKNNKARIDKILKLTSMNVTNVNKLESYASTLSASTLSIVQKMFVKNQSGGMRVFILGRDRKIHKTGKSVSKVRYMNKLITLNEAHRIEQKATIKKPMRKT